jgi:hypothetical protein
MKGWLKLAVRAWNEAKEIAPMLPDSKAKRLIEKGGQLEDDGKAIVHELKPPAAKPGA